MIISDTGPLVVLFKTDMLFLLKEIYQEVLVPEAVKTELIRKPEGVIQGILTLGLEVHLVCSLKPKRKV